MERMVGASLYGGGKGDPGCFLQGEGTISREAMGNLFGSSSSVSTGFHGSKSMMYFEDFNAATVVRPIRRRFEMEETGEDDLDEFGLNQPEKKRRLTMDQVQFLERSFELENKLEPERKMQLARDLGLQPRQVAIWFQNRRARWKTKQIEKDHEALQSSFDTLKKDHDELLKENEKLQIEVNDLKEKLLKEEKAGSNSATTNFSPRGLLLQTSSCSSQPLPPPPPFILEDLCSVNSADLDCENSHNYVEDMWHSDLSAPEEDDEEKRLETIGDYGGFEETALWFWQH